MSKDSEKVTHLGGTSPYALTCEYPPGRLMSSYLGILQEGGC